MSKRTMQVKGTTLSVDERDYISLSDICEGFEAGTALIQNWMRTRTAAEQMRLFEETNIAAIRRLRAAADMPAQPGDPKSIPLNV